LPDKIFYKKPKSAKRPNWIFKFKGQKKALFVVLLFFCQKTPNLDEYHWKFSNYDSLAWHCTGDHS